MTKTGYHHGDLRTVLLDSAAEQIASEGIEAVSLRALARRAGVSHAAPAHHFGDRAGLFTALAVQGFDLLATELAAAGPDLRDIAVAYIRFALRNPGRFDVMFRREVLRADDPELLAARERSGVSLRAGMEGAQANPEVARQRASQLAAWSVVHGFATLWREGALADSVLAGTSDPEELAREMIATIRFD
ncbi:TetR/AcrR family transcriptional regulator [Nocardia camponoti]|uniref:TetR-family transcriptional regulator n=1 Tax=Nocardia camponoti TaxID=1616106 RepID=A0A917QCX9_9NOCA|nr:TetR/AcrR family transcriptional regulator [Nocardia camponoti]GGK44284.1 putative TetR-family transcriptional regulator [Nocardia camponoti]